MLRSNTLRDTLVDYAAMRDIRQSTLEYYERTVRGFSKWLGRDAVVADLNGATISAYLTERKAGCSDGYRRNIRNGLKSLQKFHQQSGEICSVRVSAPLVQGNTPEELGRMRDASWRLDVMHNAARLPARRSEYFRAWLTLLFESCLRPADVHLIPRGRCRPGKPFGFSATKNAAPIVIQLSDLCCKLIELLPEHEFAVPPYVPDHVIRDWMSKVCEWAGVEYHARQGVRRTAGTAAEVAKPGTGHLALGNTQRVFRQSYAILSQIQGEYHGPGKLE